MFAPYQAIRCADGYITLGAANDRLFERVCAICSATRSGRPIPTTPTRRCACATAPRSPRASRRSRSTSRGSHWLALFEADGIPCGPINDYAEAFADPQIRAREMVVEVDHPTLGRLRTLGSPIKMSETPPMAARRAPLLGEHTRRRAARSGLLGRGNLAVDARRRGRGQLIVMHQKNSQLPTPQLPTPNSQVEAVMTRRQWPVLAAIPMLTIALGAQQPPPPAPPPQQPQAQGQGQGRGGRGQQTPAQREAAAREAHEREAAVPRPVPARDSVWIEELTYLEVRDAIKAGKTTALIMAGSTEQNGPYMSGGKHQYAIRLVGEAVARKLGNALIAPVIPIEAGNPENPYLEWGSLYFTAETFQSVVRDMATSLRSQGFQNIVLLGDSGGDTAGLRAVAQELSAKWTGGARIFHVPEYYNWTSPGGVRQFVNDNGIPENATAEGIHDEYGLTAVMMVNDPKIVRYDERVAAEKATINGIAIAPKEKTIEMGKKIVDFRAGVAVEAIKKALATPAASTSAAAPAAAANPRFGKWKLKSENPSSTNIMTYEPFGGTGMKITVDSTNASGTASSWGYTTMFDGKAFPVTGRNGTDSAIVRVVTDKINEIVYKQGDRVVQMLVNVLSADNQTIQVTYYSTNAQGQTNVTNATYERMQ